MDKPNNNKRLICLHCGTENYQTSQAWMDMTDSEVCRSCKKPLIMGDNSANSSDENRKSRTSLILFLLITILLLGMMFYLNRIFDIVNSKDDFLNIIYEILIILMISSAIAFGKTWQNLKYLMIWGVIFLICMIGYTYRSDLSDIKDKVLAELIPERGFQKNLNTASFHASSDGHFHIRASVNGIPIRFLADTGASHIVLSPRDAEKLGFDLKKLVFDRFYETANGKGRGSSVRISGFEIGNLRLQGIEASVNEADMRESLLGMTFFNRLEKYEVRNNVLTLYWKP
jgi:aspartyl protease family protein